MILTLNEEIRDTSSDCETCGGKVEEVEIIYDTFSGLWGYHISIGCYGGEGGDTKSWPEVRSFIERWVDLGPVPAYFLTVAAIVFSPFDEEYLR